MLEHQTGDDVAHAECGGSILTIGPKELSNSQNQTLFGPQARAETTHRNARLVQVEGIIYSFDVSPFIWRGKGSCYTSTWIHFASFFIIAKTKNNPNEPLLGFFVNGEMNIGSMIPYFYFLAFFLSNIVL